MSRSIRPALRSDLGEIFTLQRAAFVDEARIYETPFVPALDETFEAFTDRMNASVAWVAMHDARIVGSVCVRADRQMAPSVERLMVAPDCRGQGIASVLLKVAEDHARGDGFTTLQLVVGDLATHNRAIYAHLGWTQTSSERLAGFEHVVLHTLTKNLTS